MWDDPKTLVALAAFAVALLSLYMTMYNWRRSNRPVVVAFVAEHATGLGAATFNLVVANVGNRPALRVQLRIGSAAAKNLFHPEAPQNRIDDVLNVFRPESEIPLLKNGEELTTFFGAISEAAEGEKCLRYGARVDIGITYHDLDRKAYTEILTLKVYARNGFGGSIWELSKVG